MGSSSSRMSGLMFLFLLFRAEIAQERGAGVPLELDGDAARVFRVAAVGV